MAEWRDGLSLPSVESVIEAETVVPEAGIGRVRVYGLEKRVLPWCV